MEAHACVLKEYGITNVTSNNSQWMYDPNTYCIIAFTPEEQMVGGIRIQISDEKTPLPVEVAIGKMDDKIYKIVRDLRVNGGVGELCALWNAKSVAGIGLSVLLTRAGIAVTDQLSIQTLVGICADYTLKMFQQVGFVVDNSLGMNGEFPYPNPNYTARVLGIMNAASLETAAPHDKMRMRSIRQSHQQQYDEEGPKGTITVDYHLKMIKE